MTDLSADERTELERLRKEVALYDPAAIAAYADSRVRAAEAARDARWREVVRVAPHALLCASTTITKGRFPTARGDPPQTIMPRQPPDESLCDCWKVRALMGAAESAARGKP